MKTTTTKQTHSPLPLKVAIAGKHLVAENKRWGQSTGEVLIAEFLKHRYGSADRVLPDEMQAEAKSTIVHHVNHFAELQRSHGELAKAVWGIMPHLDSDLRAHEPWKQEIDELTKALSTATALQEKLKV